MIRIEAGLPIGRFCEILGLPRSTYHRWRTAGAKGPWPSPIVDRIEPVVEKYAGDWPAWGHRKIWAMMRADGEEASTSSVLRAMARRDLLQPAGYQRERRELAKARRAAFVVSPTRRNRVWQMDFSEFETTRGGTWRLGGICDYVAKLALACPLTTTQTARDAISCLEVARDRATDLLGHPLLQDCVDPATGELTPVVVVTDNGPASKSVGFARHMASRPEFTHVRTSVHSPQTNGVIERFFGSIKYEHLYREEIADGLDLAMHAERYLDVFNGIRPHEELGFRTPLEAYLEDPS